MKSQPNVNIIGRQRNVESETLIPKKCIVCGKALPKLHIGKICIVCEHEEEMMDSDDQDDSFEQFKKVTKGWK